MVAAALGTSGGRVIDGSRLGEVTRAHVQGGDVAEEERLGRAAVAFIIDEKEGFVGAFIKPGNGYRPARRAPKLIEPEGGEGGTVRREEVARVHGRIAQKFESAAVELIGARLGDDVDHRARTAPDS